jgi:hypothetical protein
MKRSRLQELAGIKKPLNEGNIWDRNEDGSMPTLADTTARYAAMKGESLDEVQGGDEEVLKSALFTDGGDLLQELEDGYYGVADSLTATIQVLGSILKQTSDYDKKREIQAELDLFRGCEKLMSKSLLGKLL